MIFKNLFYILIILILTSCQKPEILSQRDKKYNLDYNKINSIGRQWIRQYTLALSMETLGRVRSKFGSIPVPGSDVSLDGKDLISEGRSDKEKLVTSLKEMLETLTYDSLIEKSAARAENLMKQLKHVPIPNGKAIFFG